MQASHPLNLKLADVSLFGVEDDANQVAFSAVFLVILHPLDLLKRLPSVYLEFSVSRSNVPLLGTKILDCDYCFEK